MAVTKEILTLADETGDALRRNGAEVYRVEDTVLHILKAYEITDCDVYVLSNGIFASANENKEDACSMIRHVPLGSTHLGRIAALNQLSREICSHECSLRDAWVRLEECKRVLKDTGSIFVHCDRNASHYLKVLLDKIFGTQYFQSEIIWFYKRWSNSKKGLLNNHQVILFYSKTSNFKFNFFASDMI